MASTSLDKTIIYSSGTVVYMGGKSIAKSLMSVLLGIALKGVPRESYTLCTKLGRYDLQHFDFSAKRVAESVDVSLHRLGTDHLDIILCHDIEFVPMERIVDETLPALERVRHDEAVVRLQRRGLPGGSTAPVSGSMISGRAPRGEVITGVPAARASAKTMPKGSSHWIGTTTVPSFVWQTGRPLSWVMRLIGAAAFSRAMSCALVPAERTI